MKHIVSTKVVKNSAVCTVNPFAISLYSKFRIVVRIFSDGKTVVNSNSRGVTSFAKQASKIAKNGIPLQHVKNLGCRNNGNNKIMAMLQKKTVTEYQCKIHNSPLLSSIFISGVLEYETSTNEWI